MIRQTALALAIAAMLPTATLANVPPLPDSRYVASARVHFDAGRTREATLELKNALRENSGDAAARLLLGRILLQQGDLAGAESELAKAHEITPRDETAILLAETQLQRGSYEQALATAAGDGETADATVSKLAVQGAALSALNRTDEAEAIYRRILDLDSRRVEGHYGLAQVFTARKDYRAAADKLDEIVIGKPDFSAGWMLRGEVALAKGDKQAAFVAFDKAVNLSPDTIAPLVARARAHLAAGDLERAKADTRSVVNLAPNAPIAHYLRAATAFAGGDLEEANRSFTQLQRNFNQFAPAVLLGALIKHQRGDHNQADALLTRYITMQPDNIEARRALASVRLKSGRPSSAVDILTQVVSKAPNDTGSLRQLASAYLALDDYTNASAVFERLTIAASGREARDAQMALTLLDPESAGGDPALQNPATRKAMLKAIDRVANDDAKGAQALLDSLDNDTARSATLLSLKGSIAAELGQIDAARGMLTQALQTDPELTSALSAFERLDQREGTADRIVPRLKGLLDKRPESETLTLTIAQRLGMEGHRSEATDFLAERARLVPDSVHIARALVSALMVQDRFAEAADTAARLAEIGPKEPGVLVFAINALIDAEDPRRAIEIAFQLRRLMPKSPRAHTLLAEAEIKAGEIEEARSTLGKAGAQWPGDVSLAAAAVRLEARQKNPEGVRDITERLAQFDASAAMRLRADALAEMNQPTLAVDVLEKAFAKYPDQRLAVDLFSHRRRAGQDEAAFAGLEAWVDAHPDDRVALMAYATGLMETGEAAKAEKAYDTFLSLEPGNPVALNNYAWLRHRAQRPDALDHAQRAYDAASGSPEIADTYGWMLVQYGKLKEGLALLKTAREAAPDSKDIQYHFAYALSKAGRRDEAKEILVGVLAAPDAFEERAEAEALMKVLTEG